MISPVFLVNIPCVSFKAANIFASPPPLLAAAAAASAGHSDERRVAAAPQHESVVFPSARGGSPGTARVRRDQKLVHSLVI